MIGLDEDMKNEKKKKNLWETITGNVFPCAEKEEEVKFCQRQGLKYRPISSYSKACLFPFG